MGVSRNIQSDRKSFNFHKHEEKRVGKFDHRSAKKTSIGSLPRDILVDTLARVASDSFDDLFKAKLSCKALLDAAKDEIVSQSISLDKFPVTPWFPPSNKVLSFLTHCFERGNSESLFRHGMMEYFKLANVESGLEYLKRAVKKGHTEAAYVYGMILLSQQDEVSCQEGLNVLKHINYSKPGNWNVQRSRDKVKSVLDQLWINNRVILEEVKTRCKEQGHVNRFWVGWSLDENEKFQVAIHVYGIENLFILLES